MPKYSLALDPVFHALSNPTRRSVVQRLSEGKASMTELAKSFQMALPSFLQHMRILESAGLVTSNKEGRVRQYELRKDTLGEAEDWLSKQRQTWETRLDQFDQHLHRKHGSKA
jgi:DNA-binding transcriptional ArsR family regulator